MGKILIAALVGGLVMFLWEFVAHMMLPLGEMGMRQPTNEDVVLDALKTGFPEAGIYFIPSIAPEKMQDEAASKAWSEKSLASPYAYVVYDPVGRDPGAMGPYLGKQFGSDVLASLVIALVMSLGAVAIGRGALVGAGFGAFSTLAVVVPHWNWYRFPTDYLVGQGTTQIVGWALAGIAIAFILRTRRA